MIAARRVYSLDDSDILFPMTDFVQLIGKVYCY